MRQTRTLLVDDELDILTVLELVLERAGHTTTSAQSGEVALQLLREQPFDLLVTDKNLPGVDGVTLAGFARELNAQLGIILVTGSASMDSAQQLLGVADAYLVKPVSLQRFRETMEGVLERRRAGRAGDPAQGPPERVLLIVPEPRERARLSHALRALGLDVRTGSSATALDEAPAPDALVLDTRALPPDAHPILWRRLARSPGLRVVAVSPSCSVESSLNAIGLAASAHLYTSGSDAELIRNLRAGLACSESRPSAERVA
jgi:DNA-binding NtrC family response regulator